MNERSFRFFLAMVVMAIILAVLAWPGAIIGRYLAFAIALFVAFPCGLLASVLREHGIAATVDGMLIGAFVFYTLFVVALGLSAWKVWKSGNHSAGRLLVAKTTLFASLPLIVYLSTNGMTNA
jgi:hypothetical protein